MNRYELLLLVCDITGVESNQICGKRRDRFIVSARHLFFYFGRMYFGLTLCEMARLIGCHHATVIHAIRKVDGFIYIGDETYCTFVDKIKERINAEREFKLFVPYSVNLGEILTILSEYPGLRVVSAI